MLSKIRVVDLHVYFLLKLNRSNGHVSPTINSERNKNEPPHDKTSKMTCAQRRFRSAWVSAQSDQSLRNALIG